MSVWLNVAAALALTVTVADVAAGQDSLSAARELYAGAAYEDALAVLNRLRPNAVRAEDARAIDQYRAFCLLALGRASDAERAIESVIAVQPSYEPTEGDVSPRVRAAFSDVRRRMLPTIVQQWYASAKASYDRKEYGAAVTGFTQVLDVLTDPDVASAVNQPPLSDIRTLAVGFRDLSVLAAAPPPPPPATAAAARRPGAAAQRRRRRRRRREWPCRAFTGRAILTSCRPRSCGKRCHPCLHRSPKVSRRGKAASRSSSTRSGGWKAS